VRHERPPCNFLEKIPLTPALSHGGEREHVVAPPSMGGSRVACPVRCDASNGGRVMVLTIPEVLREVKDSGVPAGFRGNGSIGINAVFRAFLFVGSVI
jgi:hypothetical protein